MRKNNIVFLKGSPRFEEWLQAYVGILLTQGPDDAAQYLIKKVPFQLHYQVQNVVKTVLAYRKRETEK